LIFRRFAAAAMTAVAVIALVACSSTTSNAPSVPAPTFASTSSSTQPVVLPPLTAKVTGSCANPGGFRLESTGFTPNGKYQTKAIYPNGTPYNYLQNGGVGLANANGATPNWHWDCLDGPNGTRDTPGKYHVSVMDLATARVVEFDVIVAY